MLWWWPVAVIKFIHITVAITIVGLVSARYWFSLQTSISSITTINNYLYKIFISLITTLIITGSLLVYPKHFTFHTPWIMAAFILVLLCWLLYTITHHVALANTWWWHLAFSLLFIGFIAIIHDAVTKTTLLPL